jgi:hypothetical protein
VTGGSGTNDERLERDLKATKQFVPPLTLREEHGLKVLRRMFGPKRDEVTGGWRNCITRSFLICTLCQV